MRFGICDLLFIFSSINFCFSLNKGNDFISTFDPSLRIRTISPYDPNPLGIDLISSMLLNETCVLFLPNHPPTIVILLFVISILIMGQPDLGSTAIICILVVGILFYAGISFFQFILLLLLIVLLGYLAITTSPMRLARVLAFTDPFAIEVVRNAGWQLSNSLISIGQGGWLGVGLGNSFQKSFFLPEAHTDFIFAIIVEELGILGGLFLIVLFIILFLGLISISFDSFKKGRIFQGYTVFGIFLLITIQVLFNVAVNIGLLPTKGLTLPFISYGGTSIIIMLSLIGIALRINNENKIY